MKGIKPLHLFVYSALVIFCVLILLVALLLVTYYATQNHVLENINYKVVPRFPDSPKAAKKLRELDLFGAEVIVLVAKNRDRSPFINEIANQLRKYKPGNLMENDPLWAIKHKASASYDQIKICLRKKDGSFYPDQLLKFVLLHELAHIGTHRKYVERNKLHYTSKTNIDHPKEFWATFKFLLLCAELLGYKNSLYDRGNTEKYANVRIDYNPRYDSDLDKYLFLQN